LSCPPESIILSADPVRLPQVFSNLLNYSAKYSGSGARITVTAEQQCDDLVVKVKDTGIGIPTDMLGKVFDLFTQINPSLEPAQRGLGLGLTLVKQLVSMHGGTVEARREGAGKGAEFVVRLPFNSASAHEDGQSVLIAEVIVTSSVRHRIVVPDDRDAAKSLSALLCMMGYDVHVAFDGPENRCGSRR
jgi:signal transduction histidine kinase